MQNMWSEICRHITFTLRILNHKTGHRKLLCSNLNILTRNLVRLLSVFKFSILVKITLNKL